MDIRANQNYDCMPSLSYPLLIDLKLRGLDNTISCWSFLKHLCHDRLITAVAPCALHVSVMQGIVVFKIALLTLSHYASRITDGAVIYTAGNRLMS